MLQHLSMSPCEMLDRPLHRGGRSRSQGGRHPVPASAKADTHGGRRPVPASMKADMFMLDGVKPRAPGAPEGPRRPTAKSNSVGALSRPGQNGNARLRRPAPKCLFEETPVEVKVSQPSPKAQKAPKTTIEDQKVPKTIIEEDELKGYTTSFVSGLMKDLAEVGDDDEAVRNVEVDYDDYDEEDTASFHEDEVAGLKSKVFGALLNGAAFGGLLDALRKTEDKSVPRDFQDDVESIMTDDQPDHMDDLVKGHLGTVFDGAFRLEAPKFGFTANTAVADVGENMLLEDFDEVMSIQGDDEDELENEAISYIQMALLCAKNAINCGIEGDLEAYAAEQEQQVLDDAFDGACDETVRHIAEFNFLPYISLDTFAALAPALVREQTTEVAFRHLPSVGSWMVPKFRPITAPPAAAPAPAMAAVLEAPTAVPFRSLPSVASWYRPHRALWRPDEAAPLASPMGVPVALAPSPIALEVSAPVVDTTTVLVHSPKSVAAAPVPAALPPAWALRPRTAPGMELPLPSPRAVDDVEEAPSTASPSSSPASPMVSPGLSSRTKRRIFGAVVRPEALKAEHIDDLLSPASPKTPSFKLGSVKESKEQRSKAKKSSSSMRLQSPAGGLGPLKEPANMFRMDMDDGEEEITSPMARQSSLARLYDAMGSADIYNMANDSGSEAVERPRLRGKPTMPTRPKELGPLLVSATPKAGRSSQALRLSSALAMDLGLADQSMPSSRMAPLSHQRAPRAASMGSLHKDRSPVRSSPSGSSMLPSLSGPSAKSARPAPWAMGGASSKVPRQRMWSSGSMGSGPL